MRKIKGWEQVLYQAALVLVALFVLLPVWGLVRLAVDGSIQGAPTTFNLLPGQFTLKVFMEEWQTPAQSLSFTGLLKNSLLVAGGAALISVVLGATMAYAFARYRFPGRKPGLFMLLVGAFLPPVALMTPLYIILQQMGLRDSLWGLTIVYVAFALPFCIWNMRAAFQAISEELEEAAFLDGATPFYAFLTIDLPLALPSIAVAALVAFLAGYSEFAIGWLFVEKSANVTLAMAVWGVQTMGAEPWSKLAALALMMSVPVVVVFFALQRSLLDRLFMGAVDE